ncbi:nitrite reductase [Lacihabitans sp. LS3-19]|uniref:nitrite reductase n=1 Tax=Lacihabitans sp. LS3-19 TaxID=2487335 RepID=UPI0020CDED37|nr:nitrite reductase [Lacihabitans sp. LS3-19]MCP9767017.1 nitrite reductase [Lacihabitans sp. LS3-19]
MKSFRTELENPLVEQDILDLERKIRLFQEGEIHEDKFRSLRLARGVYGQRQSGVQMIRIKLPYGKMTFKQWKRIADVSDEYSTGNLHLTTRQDVQIHFVSLDRTPELWHTLEQDNVTLREACGNTVRNVTASVTAGIDPNEPFDVSPYAQAVFEYFLRNPICQEMGRKIKMSFSNTEEDTALAFIHDMGFLPKIENGKRGFKTFVAGGLGAQPRMADLAYEFLPENQLIPFIEAVLRVFDRHGERNSRSKARMKFLVQKIGFDTFMELVKEEQKALKNTSFEIETAGFDGNEKVEIKEVLPEDLQKFELWKNTNVFEQKQKGNFGVYVRIPLGNISSDDSRTLVSDLSGFVGDDIRVTINQGLMFRNVPKANLPFVFNTLNKIGLANPGANSVANITACPGTDTCNLAISDSTSITYEFEKVIDQEFPDLVKNNDIKIKISGCMNSCGQHGMANIGFHGSSLKSADKKVLPALQVLLGGGSLGDGYGRAAEKVIKVPSKRGPDVLRLLFRDYQETRIEGEYFNDFFERKGKNYFYELLKPLASLDSLVPTDFVDWGQEVSFETAIGIGECAGVMIDLVGTLFLEAQEKLEDAKAVFGKSQWADAIYLAYSAQVNAAKALLLDIDVNCNTQMKVISEFTKNFDANFEEKILRLNKVEPSKDFALDYINDANLFCEETEKRRENLKKEEVLNNA